MDDHFANEAEELDIERFHEWLEQVADQRGVDEYELLQQLMSAFWMMDELSSAVEELDLVRGPDSGDSSGREVAGSHDSVPEQRAEDRATDAGTDGPTADESRESPSIDDDRLLTLVESLKDWNAGEAPSHAGGLDSNVIELVRTVLEANDQASGVSRPIQSTRGDEVGLLELVQAVQGLHQSSVDSGRSATIDRDVEELHDEVGELEQDLKRLATELSEVDQRSQQQLDDLSEAINALSNRVDGIADDVDQAASTEAVEAVEEAVSNVADELTSVRNRADTEFDEFETQFERVETILTHLFDRVDEQAAERQDLADRVTTVETRMAVLDAVEAVGEIKAEANRRDISEASCDACGSSHRIGLLTRPECPDCGAAFDGLSTRSSWLRTKHFLTTSGESPASQSDPPGTDGDRRDPDR